MRIHLGVYAKSPLNLRPESPSQFPPVDSRSGWLGFCTENWDGIPPSWAARLAAGGRGTVAAAGIPGEGSWCAESGRTVAASSEYIVDVGAAAVVVVAAADVGAGVNVVGGDGDGGPAHDVEAHACPSAMRRGRSAARLRSRPRGRGRNPWQHSAASRTRGWGSRIVDSKVVAPEDIDRCRSGSRRSPGSAADTSAPRWHLPRTVELGFPVGESDVDVWSGWFCDRSFVHKSVLDIYMVACPCGFCDAEPNWSYLKRPSGSHRDHRHAASPQCESANVRSRRYAG